MRKKDKKDFRILISVTKNQKKQIKENASNEHMSMSEFLRWCSLVLYPRSFHQKKIYIRDSESPIIRKPPTKKELQNIVETSKFGKVVEEFKSVIKENKNILKPVDPKILENIKIEREKRLNILKTEFKII